MIQKKIFVKANGRQLLDITKRINEVIQETGNSNGLCNVFLHHTSASLIINENDDPQVLKDLENFMIRLVPDGDSLFKHVAEGPDDMPAHVRTVLTQTSLNIPFNENKLALGKWQGVFLWEHRIQSPERQITITITN